MTNAKKFEEVFGFAPDCCECPTYSCDNCPSDNWGNCASRWWNSEYKETTEGG